MKSLSQNLVDIISSELSGKRLEKFQTMVKLINESLLIDAWVKGASQKRSIGMERPKIEITELEYDHKDKVALRQVYSLIFYGSKTDYKIEDYLQYINLKKHSVTFLYAWGSFYEEHREACRLLDMSRPIPVITAIGLSPTVTKTLKEMNLDLDLSSIKMAEIAYKMIPMIRKGKPVLNKEGKPILEKEYYIKWSEGIAHGKSRFSFRKKLQCEACGHALRSGRFVPVEAFDKNLNCKVSLLIGCDCSKNIFGIKDVGIDLKE